MGRKYVKIVVWRILTDIFSKMTYSCQPERLLSERQQVTSFGEDTERREHLCTAGGKVKMAQPLWKTVWWLLVRLNITYAAAAAAESP